MPKISIRYRPPTQDRAIQSERDFLDAFDELMALQGYKNTTVSQIAAKANLSGEAFMKRFGTKHQALLVLYERYCDKASQAMTRIVESLSTYDSLDQVLLDMSTSMEQLVKDEYSSNRAMHEDFAEHLRVHEMTQDIFRQCVDMMTKTQEHFIEANTYSPMGAYSAAQLLVTITYSWALHAMPGLPRDAEHRHSLITDLLRVALNR